MRSDDLATRVEDGVEPLGRVELGPASGDPRPQRPLTRSEQTAVLVEDGGPHAAQTDVDSECSARYNAPPCWQRRSTAPAISGSRSTRIPLRARGKRWCVSTRRASAGATFTSTERACSSTRRRIHDRRRVTRFRARWRRSASESSGSAPGDRVAVQPMISCGACEECTAGRHALCGRLEHIGVARSGGFAELCLAPAENLYLLPPEVSDDEGALARLHGRRRARARARSGGSRCARDRAGGRRHRARRGPAGDALRRTGDDGRDTSGTARGRTRARSRRRRRSGCRRASTDGCGRRLRDGGRRDPP